MILQCWHLLSISLTEFQMWLQLKLSLISLIPKGHSVICAQHTIKHKNISVGLSYKRHKRCHKTYTFHAFACKWRPASKHIFTNFVWSFIYNSFCNRFRVLNSTGTKNDPSPFTWQPVINTLVHYGAYCDHIIIWNQNWNYNAIMYDMIYYHSMHKHHNTWLKALCLLTWFLCMTNLTKQPMASTWMDLSSRARNPVLSFDDKATYLAANNG